MARPSRDVARMQLTLDEQNLDFFNQMESWQSFTWPGNTYYPGVSLRWRSVNSGMQLYTSHQGNWGFIRLLDKALITPLDASRTQLVWITPDGNPLKFVMRSELGDGPLALLKLQDLRCLKPSLRLRPALKTSNKDKTRKNMSSPEALLSACTTNHEAQLRLTESASGTLSLWENWLKPVRPGAETGDDPASDDDFQLMREEINKLSGTDPDLLCTTAEKILCESAKDIRVVTWYTQPG